jgi:dimethylhistidine N-methyltransferase
LGHSGQKTLSPRWFYDEVGSALFEAITFLPEYGLSRADSRLLERYASEIVGCCKPPLRIVELGSGTGSKTRWLLEAAVLRQEELIYSPIDVSLTAIDACAHSLGDVPGVSVVPQNDTYLPGLRASLAERPCGAHVLVLFLGSTIGNFDPFEAVRFLSQLRTELEVGDALLLGTDLVKPLEQLLVAYDDPVGVTAAFNRNLLARINRELNGEFDPQAFAHVVRFDRNASRIEMHLRSEYPQTVPVHELKRSFRFAHGETIWTESSYKFTLEGVRELARNSGFHCIHQWEDAEWPFAENLLIAQ